MSYVKTINEDGVVSDIMAVALDSELDATLVHKSEVTTNTDVTTEGQVADARAIKTLTDDVGALTDTAKRTHGVTEIPENADLNTYATAGEYYIVNNTIAASVANTPNNEAGRLTVEYEMNNGGQYVRQIYKTYTLNQFERRSTNSGSTWGSWYAVYLTSADTVTVSTLESEFKPYNDKAVNYPRLYKRNGVVIMSALLSPKADIAIGTGTHKMFTIPEGYRPLAEYYAIQQGSSNNIWHMTVNTNGTVTFARYRTGDTEKIATAGSWLPFSGTWVTNG